MKLNCYFSQKSKVQYNKIRLGGINVKKRILTMLIAATMVASIAGCAKKEGSIGKDSATNTTAGGKLLDKKIEVTYFLADENNNVPITDDLYVFKQIEEKTNIKLKTIPVPLANYNEKLGTTLASGDLPDLMAIRGSKYPLEYGPQGAFVNLSEYIDKGKMPNFKKMMDGIDNSWTITKAGDGNVYGAPRLYDFTWITESFLARHDILKKNNLSVPKSFDELYTVMKKLKEANPTMVPLTNRWKAGYYLGSMADSFHTGGGMYFNNDTGKWNFGPLEENYKEMLAYSAKLYKEGLLDKEFATQADSQWEEKLVNGKSVFTYTYLAAAGELKAKGLAADTNWDFSGMLPLEYKGKITGAPTLSSCYVAFNKTISSKSKYKDELVKFIDWTYSPEGIEVTNVGKENETFKRENGKAKYTDMIKTADNPNGQKSRFDLGLENQNIFSVKGKDTLDLRDPAVIKGEKLILDAKLFDKPAPTVNLADDVREKYNNIITPLTTYVEEMSLKVIMGSMDINEWDKAVAKMKEMKVDEAIKLYQDAYNKIYKK